MMLGNRIRLVALLACMAVASACASPQAPGPSGGSGSTSAAAGDTALPVASASPIAGAPSPAAAATPGASATGAAPSPDPACAALLDDTEAIAAGIYAEAARAADLVPQLDRVLRCLGVQVVPASSDDATLRSIMDGTAPVVMDFEIDSLAASLRRGTLVDLDSFLSDLASRGVLARATGRPIDRPAWDTAVQDAARAPGAVVPRLLLALGHERARVAPRGTPDPVWGDPTLDTFQFLLVALGLQAAAANGPVGGLDIRFASFAGPQTAEVGALVDWLALILDRVEYGIPGLAQGRFNICTQTVLDNVTMVLSGAPTTIWHKRDGRPSASRLTATLALGTEYGPRASAALALAGCPPWPQGGIPGKTVRWYRDANAQAHGRFVDPPTVTDGAGVAAMTYATIPETAPQDAWTAANEQQEDVTIEVQVQDLLDSFPATLIVERVIWGTEPNPNNSSPSGSTTLDVHFYKVKDYRVATANVGGDKCDGPGGTWNLKLRGKGGGGTVNLSGDITLQIDKDTLEGPFQVQQSATVPGKPAGAEFSFRGTATFIATDPPSLRFDIQGGGTGFGYAFGFVRTGTGQGATMSVPVTEGDFCP